LTLKTQIYEKITCTNRHFAIGFAHGRMHAKREYFAVGRRHGNTKSASVNSSYIVVLKKDSELAKSDLKTRETGVKAKAYGLLKKYDITAEPDYVYETALQGFAVKMAPGQAKKMELDNAVSYIEADQIITLSPEKITGKPTEGTSTQPAQQTPWGITRVGGISSYTGSGVAWIIDTGVDLTHPDLNVGSGVSFVPRVTSPNDDNGHGTHVAGTIAAINNTIGVVGVAPGAKVIPVKVLDKKGSGTTSGVISGINYVAANGKSGDVANMSLGGGVSTALDEAVLSASSVVKFALAAGNESDDANNHSRPGLTDQTSTRYRPWTALTNGPIFQIMVIRQLIIVHQAFLFIQPIKAEVMQPFQEHRWQLRTSPDCCC
jgi:subtilisin family serine protease